MASVWKHPESQIAEEFERAAKTKRTLKQVQKVLDRLHEEVSGERVVRATFRTYLNDWLTAKQAENAVSTMAFLPDESEQVFCSFSVSKRKNRTVRSQKRIS